MRRSPKDYFAVVDLLENKEADGRYSHFELISCKCVDTYVRVKKNQSQICWKWKKVSLFRWSHALKHMEQSGLHFLLHIMLNIGGT